MLFDQLHEPIQNVHCKDKESKIIGQIPKRGSKRNLDVRPGTMESHGSVFGGAVIDTGAARSCIGLRQARAYMKRTGNTQMLQTSSFRFKFGDVIHDSNGVMKIILPTPSGHDIEFETDVVEADVPLLLGYDVLCKHGLNINIRESKIEHKDWAFPIVHRSGHLWVQWMAEVHYTKAELLKLHRHFRHPSSEKLFALLKRIKPDDLPKSTLSVLKEIQKSCEPCSRIDRRQVRFQVGSVSAEDIVFNREIALDLMKIGERNVLHVIDIGTHFGAAQVLDNVHTASVWDAFMSCWTLIYAGQPDIMFCDQGSVFTSDLWKSNTEENGVILKFSGVQHHHGISLCERYHVPLRNIFRKVEIQCPTMEPEAILKVSIKAMNDTLGPEGLVPSYLVFNIMPRYSPVGLDGDLPNQKVRFEAIRVAREEYFRISNNLRVTRALRAKVPESADHIYNIGEFVRVYREERKSYSVPYRITAISDNGRMVSVEVRPGNSQLYSISQLKPYHGPEAESEEVIEDIRDAFGPWCRNYVSPHYLEMHPVEIIDKRDPRAMCPKMRAAIQKEISGLLERGTFKIVLRSEVPEGANILGGRLVLCIKDVNTGEEKYRPDS